MTKSFSSTDFPSRTQWAAVTWLALVLFAGLPPLSVARPEDCGDRLRNCTEMVRPFLHDLKYMFPTTINDVDKMCKMWSGFVHCIRRYTKDCATQEQRDRFNQAVGDSVDTVHAICSSEKYQKEYLQSASCFRKVSVDNCGSHYNDLVEEVTNTVANNDHICCSYSKFKVCVSEPLLRMCGARARTIMDHSMAFLIHRCSSKSFSLSYECPKSRGRAMFNEKSPGVSPTSAPSDFGMVDKGNSHSTTSSRTGPSSGGRLAGNGLSDSAASHPASSDGSNHGGFGTSSSGSSSSSFGPHPGSPSNSFDDFFSQSSSNPFESSSGPSSGYPFGSSADSASGPASGPSSGYRPGYPAGSKGSKFGSSQGSRFGSSDSASKTSGSSPNSRNRSRKPGVHDARGDDSGISDAASSSNSLESSKNAENAMGSAGPGSSLMENGESGSSLFGTSLDFASMAGAGPARGWGSSGGGRGRSDRPQPSASSRLERNYESRASQEAPSSLTLAVASSIVALTLMKKLSPL